MKLINQKPSSIFLPAEKRYYLWVFIALLIIFVTQFFIYPKIIRIHVNQVVVTSFQRQMKLYEEKSAADNQEKKQILSDINSLNSLFASNQDPLTLFSALIIDAKPRLFTLKQLSIQDKIQTNYIEDYPLQMEIQIPKANLGLLFDKIQQFPYPIEIINLSLDGQTTQLAPIEMTLQLIIKKKRG